MKLRNLLVVGTLLIGVSGFAQDGSETGEERECLRMRKIANDAMSFTNYKEAVEYFIKAENICDEFGKENYERLIACTQSVMNDTEGEENLKYLDTLLRTWERMEEKGLYNEADDINRGYYYLQQTNPDIVNADKYLIRGIAKQGKDMNELFIPLYYFNIYSLWYVEQDEEAKEELKQRLIKEYFSLSKLINEANFAPKIQEDLTTYMRQVINTCDDILPMMPRFLKALPTEKGSSMPMMMDMANLLIDLECKKSKEFKRLADTLYTLDPNNPDVIVIYLEGVSSPREKIDAYEKLLSNATTEEEKNKYRYKIAAEYFNMNSYNTAYNKAKAVSGEYRGSALSIMGQSVGATAMSCGESTFERKSNYVYAVQLLEQAQANGASGLGGVISSYKSNYPAKSECFDAGNPSSITLTCWGVSVAPCQ